MQNVEAPALKHRKPFTVGEQDLVPKRGRMSEDNLSTLLRKLAIERCAGAPQVKESCI